MQAMQSSEVMYGLSLPQRRKRVDDLYNFFTSTLETTMIDTETLLIRVNRHTKRTKQADETLARLITEYNKLSRALETSVVSPCERIRIGVICNRLEDELQQRNAECAAEAHRDLLRRIHSHDRDGMTAAMFRAIKGTRVDSIVFEHEGEKLYDTCSTMRGLESYFRGRIGERIETPGRTNAEADALLRKIELDSYNDDAKDDAAPYSMQEFQSALHRRGLNKAVGLDGISYRILRTLSELLRFETKDPRLQGVSLTAVDLTRDLSVAKVYFSILGGRNHTRINT